MGQQQLLLLVLGVVIVALAVVVGIAAFEEHEVKTQYDLATNDAVQIAGELIAWRGKSATFGGGEGDQFLESASFSDLGFVIRGTNVNQSQTTTHRRALGGLATNRPWVEVYPLRNPDLRVRSYLYGPSEACLFLRRRVQVDGAWAYQPALPSYANRPAGCAGW